MSSFSGFTDADIRTLQNGGSITSTKMSDQKVTVTAHRKAAMVSKQSKNPPMSKQDMKKLKVLENKLNNSGTDLLTELPDEAKLMNIPLSHSNDDATIAQSTNIAISNNNSTVIIDSTSTTKDKEKEANEKKCIDLDMFQVKQKHMEEQNRLRKEQVAKALEDRTKRTLKEQQKLVEIQNEFKQLDATLSSDVKILRKEIEGASYEYMEAQKKYDRIEKEFLDAKFCLHQKLEKKELLTEHLCAIIEKNEERKADKLNELLLKLEVLDGSKGNIEEDVKVQDEEVTSNLK